MAAQEIKNFGRPWTKKEFRFIEKNWLTMKDAEMAEQLGRTRPSVAVHRVKVLKLVKERSGPTWTEEDDEMMRSLYGQVDTRFLAAMLSRTFNSLKSRAFDLGISSPKTVIALPWSKAEIEILRLHYPTQALPDFAHLLPGRPLDAIKRKLMKLHLKRDPAYLLASKNARFSGYPRELQELIHLLNQVQRKLKDVEAKHREPAGASLQGARKPRRRREAA